MTGAVHVVVPASIDDPQRVSGGSVYDRRVIDGLGARGWAVHEMRVDPDRVASVAGALATIPDAATALLDGLVAVRAPEAVEAAAERLRVVVLAHMVCAALPAEAAHVVGERRALRAATRVIVTSPWSREELVRRRLAAPDRIAVAVPGADDAPPATGTGHGGELLCVGAVAPHKGTDVLVEALAGLAPGGSWRCTIAGSLAVDPAFAKRVVAAAEARGIRHRLALPGVLTRPALAARYDRADLLVAPSRAESYGIAVADALRRGIPVVASAAGGLPHAVAGGPGAAILVPPGDAGALRDALGRWIADPALRRGMRAAAAQARMPSWSDTVDRVAAGLEAVR